MRPVLTPSESSALDRESLARGVAVEELMERAGRAVARAALDLTGGAYGRRAVVVCGKGNNGGDGLVAARQLALAGMGAMAVMLEAPENLREPAATMLARAREAPVRVRTYSDSSLPRELDRADVAIDAIFGTGFRGSPEDDFAAAIDDLNASVCPIVAVDIPSGVNGETGLVEGEAVWATLSVCLGAEKLGVVLSPGAERAGIVRVADIGFPEGLVRSDVFVVEAADVVRALPAREPDTHKRATGVVLVIGGSHRMTGAVCLMAEAAYRIGAGLVTIATPESALAVAQQTVREATFLPLPETVEGTASVAAFEVVEPLLSEVDAVSVGPGMSTNEQTAGFVRRLVRECPVPLVVDADALNAFAGRAGDLASRAADAVVTPHAGEFGRLAGLPSRDVTHDRVGNARKLAAETQAIVLLKGSRTVIAAPAGEVRINPTGSAVLATAGSGDVLTGTIAGLAARGTSVFDAATVGAYVHGLAGSLAGEATGEGTTAGDVARAIPLAVLELRGR